MRVQWLLLCLALASGHKPHIIFHVRALYGMTRCNSEADCLKAALPWKVIDDWGFHDVGFRNSEMRTPTLDYFHRRGSQSLHHAGVNTSFA